MPCARLLLEQLEDRSVPVITSTVVTSGVLYIYSDNQPTHVTIRQDSGLISVQDSINGFHLSVPDISIQRAVWVGGLSADYLDARGLHIPIWASGGPGNDILVGSLRSDRLFGEAGWDRLYGMAGRDWLEGGEEISSGDGSDWIAEKWAVSGATTGDIHEQEGQNCAFLSSLAGVSRHSNLASRIRYRGGFAYDVALWSAGSWRFIRVRFDGETSNQDPLPATEYESWVVLYARAWYAFRHGNVTAYPDTCLTALTGKPTHMIGPYSPTMGRLNYSWIVYQLGLGRTLVTATYAYASTPKRLSDGHAYTILATSNGNVLLYDPHGFKLWVPWSTIVRDCWAIWSV